MALPDRVGHYGTAEEFDGARVESGQWVFWQDRVDLVLQGRYDEVKPLHVELSPTYLCNFSCPWCSCRSAREDWIGDDVFSHPLANSRTVMPSDKLEAIVRELARSGVGIMWVGGEPTMHRGLYPAARLARALGLAQSLFTNGSLLNPRRVDELIDIAMAFIRVSVDAVDDRVHQEHHGYRAERPYARRVRDNLRQLVRTRNQQDSPTLIGVSAVVDDTNLADIVPLAHFIASLDNEAGSRGIDYLIVRPTYQFYASQVRLGNDTSSRLGALVAAGGEVEEVLRHTPTLVVAPQASFLEPPQASGPTVRAGSTSEPVRIIGRRRATTDLTERCLAAGWFGEITSAGALVVCSDRYGNPDYFIGDLSESGLDAIWKGDRRRDVLDMVETSRCFAAFCPANGRGRHLNTVFRDVEAHRRAGRLDAVVDWITELQRTLPRPAHSFFL